MTTLFSSALYPNLLLPSVPEAWGLRASQTDNINSVSVLTSPDAQSTDIWNTQVLGDLLSSSSIQWCKRKRWQCARWLRCAAWVPCSRCSPPGRSAPLWFCVGCCPGWWELWQCRRSFGQAAPFLQPQKKWRPDSNHLRYSQFAVCHNTTQAGNGNSFCRQRNAKSAHKGIMERLTGKNRHLDQQPIQVTNMLKFMLGQKERWFDRKSASCPVWWSESNLQEWQDGRGRHSC